MSIVRRLAAIGLLIALLAGIGITHAPASEAADIRCEGHRCALHLSKKETRDWAYHNILPNIPGNVYGVTGLTQAAFALVMMAHRWFVVQYANEDRCVSFVLSAIPWEAQGLYGRRC